MDDQNNQNNPPTTPATPPVDPTSAFPSPADTSYVPEAAQSPQPTFTPPSPVRDYSAVFPQVENQTTSPIDTPAPSPWATVAPTIPVTTSPVDVPSPVATWPNSTTPSQTADWTQPVAPLQSPISTPQNPFGPPITPVTDLPAVDLSAFPQPITSPTTEPIEPPPIAIDPTAAPTPIPTFTPPTPTDNGSFSGVPSFGSPQEPGLSTQGIPSFADTPSEPQGPALAPEPAPTDLSQLSDTDNQPPPPEVYTPPVASNENLIVSVTQPSGIPESLETGSPKKTMMPILMTVGGILLLLIIGISIYFILGIGKNRAPETTSLLIQQAPLTSPPKAVTASPAASQTVASDSGSFGALNGATASAKPTSALEAARQRAAQASPSPSPTK